MHSKNGITRIEKKGFASHTVRIEERDHPEGLPDEFRNAKNRALDMRVLETYLPDGSMTQTFLDEVETKHNGM
jgi:hypothetical protein